MRLLHVITVLAAALTLAACGGSQAGSAGSAGSTSTTTSDSDRDAARVRLQECMAEHGVEIGGAANADQRKLEEAMEACKEYRQDAFGDLDDEDRQELQDQLDKLTQCMRDHGVDVPDVKVGAGAVGGIDRTDPDVQEALDACRDEAPKLGSSR